MRVLIADEFEQSGQDELARLGCEVRFEPKLKDEALAAGVEQFRPDVLVVRGTKVPEAVLAAGALKLVVRAGAGYNTIDVAAASRRGIYVSNCPGKNSIAVAELAFGLILALDRQIPDNVIALRQGRWNKNAFSKARGLFGRTLGLIGLGQIGREVALRAKAFGLPVVAWSRSLTADAAGQLGVQRMDSPVAVAAASDIVSLHVALNAQTKGMIDALFFAAMRPGAYFINTARAEVVDQAAFARAIEEKGIRAGLDVFAVEPSGGAGEFATVSRTFPPSTARTTSARLPSRRRKPSARRPCASSVPFYRPARCRTWSTWRAPHPRLAPWWSVTWIAPACSPECWMQSAWPKSTCRKWKTSSSKAHRPQSRGFIWRPRRGRT